MTTIETHPHTEGAVAQMFGLTIFDVRKIRKTLPPEMISRIDGCVRYTHDALEAIKKAAGVDGVDPHQVEKTPTAVPQQADAIKNMRVERLCPNPTWVRCRDEHGAMVDVKVLNNRNMHRDQWIEAIAMPDGRFWMVRERAT